MAQKLSNYMIFLMKRHGGDLENPTFSELNKKEMNLYYAVIIPKLKKILLYSNVFKTLSFIMLCPL